MIADGFRVVPIVVLIGARQVGKTSLMNTLDVKGKKLFLNGQDAEVAALFQKLSIIEPYLKSYLNKSLKGYLMIDEFQYISNLSEILDELAGKHKELKILCSGSSSIEAVKLKTRLANKANILEILPFSFEEFLLVKEKRLYKLLQGKNQNVESSDLAPLFNNLLNEYLIYGGMPRVVLSNEVEDKFAALVDILNPITFIKKSTEYHYFVDLLKYLALRNGNTLNINKASAETGIPYKKCEEYMYLLEQMYIIKMLEPYESNRRKSIVKMKKVFFCDTGLRNMIVKNFNDMDFREDNGAIFENYIMLELRRNIPAGGTIHFFRTSDGAEVDFVLNNLKEKIAVESKYKTMAKPVGLAAFNRFCDDENIQKRYIVNKNLNTIHNGVKFIQGFLAKNILGKNE
jgi:predicted AAA+ superfamily ATPase